MHLVFARRNRCNRFIFSQQDASDSSAPGWFTQRCPFFGCLTYKCKHRDGTKQLYGLRPIHVPMKRRRCLRFPSRGIWKRGVPETSPCHVQAKQIGELDPRRVTRGCRERSRGIETSTELVIGKRKRIGSVHKRLCTWAASAGSCVRKPAVTDAAANQSVRGRAFAAGESDGIEVPDIDSRAMRSLLCLS